MILTCPNCGKEVEQEIVAYRETKGGVEYVLRCSNCGYTYKKHMKEQKMRDIKVILSWRDKSRVSRFTTFEDEILRVGDEIRVEGVNALITAIDSNGKRVDGAVARDVDEIWAKRFDRVILKISVNRGERTVSEEMVVDPNEEFYIGDILDLSNFHAVIHKIKTEERFIHRGGAPAREIVRIYAKEIREGRRKY